MCGDLIETLQDCANALDELLPRDHAYRKIVEQANRLLAMQAAEALKKEREAHAETNKVITDALLMMEERKQRDEALLRQALEALEELQYAVISTAKTEDVSLYYSVIVALHKRLGVKA